MVFVSLAVGGGLDDEQVVVGQAFSGVEGPGQTACGAGGQEREGNDLVHGLGALRGEDLVELQLDLGPDVELGARVDGGRGVGDDVGRLGASSTLPGLLAGCGTAAGGDGPRRGT